MKPTTDKAVAKLLVLATEKGMISKAKLGELHELFLDLAMDFGLEAEANSGSKLELARSDLAGRLADEIEEEIARADERRAAS